MNRFTLLLALLLMSPAGAQGIQAILDDPGRPGSDREDDERRKPEQVMQFSGVSAGDVILEIGAGRGYTTELVSRLIGADGKLYAHSLDPARVIGNRLPNVSILPPEPEDLGERFSAAGIESGSVDRVLAFFSLHDGYLASPDRAGDWYAAMLDILKPGGEFVVLDNSAPEGSGLEYTADLHRIAPDFLKDDIIAAGFEFVAESMALRNPDDDLTSGWFEDTETRKAGYQDRFAFKFRKP
jgi:predicted methyltransferase